MKMRWFLVMVCGVLFYGGVGDVLALDLRGIPKRHGKLEGKPYIAQRDVREYHQGWGWIQPEKGMFKPEPKWVVVQEEPGVMRVPHRFTRSEDVDHGMRYRFYGHFADYEAYEPKYNVFVPVFVLTGWEMLSPGKPVDREPLMEIAKKQGVRIQKPKSVPFQSRGERVGQ